MISSYLVHRPLTIVFSSPLPPPRPQRYKELNKQLDERSFIKTGYCFTLTESVCRIMDPTYRSAGTKVHGIDDVYVKKAVHLQSAVKRDIANHTFH